MNVILCSADSYGLYPVFLGDAAEVGPKPLSELCRDEGPTFFGAEYTMDVGTDVRHRWIQPSLRD